MSPGYLCPILGAVPSDLGSFSRDFEGCLFPDCDRTNSHPDRTSHSLAVAYRCTGNIGRISLRRCQTPPAVPVSIHSADQTGQAHQQRCRCSPRYFFSRASWGAHWRGGVLTLSILSFRHHGEIWAGNPWGLHSELEFLAVVVSGVGRESGNCPLHSVARDAV